MSLEHDLRCALQEQAGNVHAPPELKEKILDRIPTGQGGRRMKKWLMAAIVAAALIIPTGAYAGYNYLADTLYGSQDSLAQIGGTQQQYDRLEAKLQQSRSSLSEEDFKALTSLLHELAVYNRQIADEQGVLQFDKLSDTDLIRYKKLAAEVEPFNAKLNQAGAPLTATTMTDSDFAAFSDRLLDKAEQTFSGKELARVRQLIEQWKEYNASLTGPDGSRLEPIPDDRMAEQTALLDKLNPYLKKMGYMFKPATR